MKDHWICECGNSIPNRVSKCPQCGQANPKSKHHSDNDTAFPAGMPAHSPMLEHINKLDNLEKAAKPQQQRRREGPARANQRLLDPDFIDIDSDYDKPKSKSRWPFFGKASEPAKHKTQDDGIKFFHELDETDNTSKKKTVSWSPIIVSVVLVVALIISIFHTIQNFEDMTRWLASPTISEHLTPSLPAMPEINIAKAFSDFFNTHSENSTSATTPSTPPEQDRHDIDTSPAAVPEQPVDATPVTTTQTIPVVSDLEVKSIAGYGATITWKSDQPCMSKLTIRTEAGEPSNYTITEKYVRDHHEIRTNLDSGKKYFVKVTCWNDKALLSEPVEISFETPFIADTTPPQLIVQPQAIVSDSTATISWKTNENTKSKVQYGTSTDYIFSTSETDGKSREQNIFISSLNSDTLYHYHVISVDAAGNTFTSDDFQFKTSSVTDTAPTMGNKAPGFTLKSLDGDDVSLSQFLGKKVVLNFWASWCTPCKIEMPHLKDFWDKYRDSGEVVVIAVAGSQSDESVIRSFAEKSGIDFIVCLDSTDNTFNQYSIVSIPKTYFIDQSGVIRKLQQGMFTSPGEIEFMYNSY